MRHLLSHLLLDSAERHPERPALRDRGFELSYAELARRALALAGALRARGLRRGDRVALFCDKSHEALTGLWGVLAAGGAYVPIDATAPAARVATLLHDSGARHVVTQPAKLPVLEQALPGSAVEWVLGVADSAAGRAAVPWAEILETPPAGPGEGALTEFDPAYVLYTSGSTGHPKGILHTQRSALAFVEWSVAHFQPRPDDRFSSHAPLQFDLSIFDVFASVAAGACTVLVPEAVAKLPASLSQLIQDERLTFWYSVPFALVQLLERGALARRDLSSLRCIIFAGEAMPPASAAELRRRFPAARLANLYGPTETNVCTWFDLPDTPWPAERPLPIGYACANTELLVLDADQQPVESGGSGELLVRGATVMAAYWAAPDKTERAFHRPAQAAPYERPFYRTGDLVRVEPGAPLQFLGRRDRQIKQRGYRIELDEVEQVLARHPDVAEAAVWLAEDPEAGPQLEAAAAARAGRAPSVADLRAYLAAELPPHALPAGLRVLDRMPRTATGKIDRGTLSKAGRAAAAPESASPGAVSGGPGPRVGGHADGI